MKFPRSPSHVRALSWAFSLAGLVGFPTVGAAQADDWSVSRSEFDPRVIGLLKADLRKRPEDLALLRRLMSMYRRHRTLDALGSELRETARKGTRWDAFIVGEFERERGQIDEALAWFDQATSQGGATSGPDAWKLAQAKSDALLKKAPPDLKAASERLAEALASLDANDPRRRPGLRRLAGLYTQASDTAGAERAFSELLRGATGSEAALLRRDLAETLAKAGKPKEAAEALRQALAAGGIGDGVKRAEAELRLGELQEAAGDDTAAAVSYRQALSRVSDGHYLRREIYDRLIAVARKKDELPLLLAALEKEWPAASRDVTKWEVLGRLYDERGDSQAAKAAYQQALRRAPHQVDLRRRLIAILERAGTTGEVIQEYQALIAQVPGDARPYVELAERFYKLGQRPEALAWLRRAAARFAGDASLHGALLDLYQRWGEGELALRQAELLVRLEPREEGHVVTLGELYWTQGKKDRADEIWKRLLTLGKSRAAGQARLADVYAEHNLMARALELYDKAVLAEPNNLVLRRGLALAQEQMNRPSPALEQWDRIYFAARDPSDRLLRLEARTHLGLLLQKETRLLPMLYSWQRRLAAQTSGLSGAPMAEGDLVALAILVADVCQKLGQTKDALEALTTMEKRLTPGPLLGEILLVKVQVLQRDRRLEEAIAALKLATTMLPARKRELDAQLAELSLQGYRDEDAVRYARQAVVDADGELRLGEILERRDDVPGAMAAYKRALVADGQLARAQLALGRLHAQQGDLQEAGRLYTDLVKRSTQEELILDAGRRAIDVYEYSGHLGDLFRELSPLSYGGSPQLHGTYRKLMLMLYERYVLPLTVLARSGGVDAAGELVRLGQSNVRPLTEALIDGDSSDQKLAVALLAGLQAKESALPLLGVALLGDEPPQTSGAKGAKGGKGPLGEGARRGTQGMAPRPARSAADIDLRVNALLAAATLRDPRGAGLLRRLANSPEKALRMGAVYGLIELLSVGRRADAESRALFENGLQDANPVIAGLCAIGLAEEARYAGRPQILKVRTQLAAILEQRRGVWAMGGPLLIGAVHGLGTLRLRENVELLTRVSSDGQEALQVQALWGLAESGDPAVLPSLLTAAFGKGDAQRSLLSVVLGVPQGVGHRAPQPTAAAIDRIFDHLLDQRVRVVASPPAPGTSRVLDPKALQVALGGALSAHADVVLRTLGDLRVALAARSSSAPVLLGPIALGPGETGRLLLSQGLQGVMPRLVALGMGTEAQDSDGAMARAALDVLGEALAQTAPAWALSQRAAQEGLQAIAQRGERASALLAIERLAHQDAVSGPLLDRLIESKDRRLRLRALEVLLLLPKARQSLASVPVLERASRDPDGYIADAAQQALQHRSK